MPRRNREIYDHLRFSLGWIFSSGGQYHGELPEIHYCYAAGSGGDRCQQRTLSSTQEANVVSMMNLGADQDDDDVMQVWLEGRWSWRCCSPSLRLVFMRRIKKKEKCSRLILWNDIILLSGTAASLLHRVATITPTPCACA